MAARMRGRGRPPKYKDVAEIEAKISAYFDACEGEPAEDPETGGPLIDRRGNVVYIGRKPPTMGGLARALGFRSRQSLLNYEGRADYRAAIEAARERVAEYAEERLYDSDGCRGAMFSLRVNFGWEDGGARGAGGDVEDLTPLAKMLGD